MPKSATHALTWCPDTSRYTVRDPEHARTLAAIFGNALTLSPDGQEWFAWLATLPSFAFTGKEGRFTARRETKQRGESYWVAYQRVGGKLRKKYLGKLGELTAEKLEKAARSINAQACAHPAVPSHETAPAPPLPPHVWATIPEQIMRMDIGQAPKGPPYDDTFWLPTAPTSPWSRQRKSDAPSTRRHVGCSAIPLGKPGVPIRPAGGATT
jgi:hypothetical protein